MADIVIFAGGIAYSPAGSVYISGSAVVSGGEENDPIGWEVIVPFSTLAAGINSAIRDAAITAAENAGHTIGLLDKKTLLASAVGL